VDGDGEPSRYGFTSTPFSLVTIFIVLTGENWNQIMVETMGTYNTMAGPAIYFMIMIIIGNYMLLNLFLAILLKFIGEKDENEDDLDEKADPKLKKQETEKDDKLQPSEESEDSLGLNSSNSNLEEEFEQIKRQLQELSKINMTQQRTLKGLEKDFEGGIPDNEESDFDDGV
jgi:hypothetical protein